MEGRLVNIKPYLVFLLGSFLSLDTTKDDDLAQAAQPLVTGDTREVVVVVVEKVDGLMPHDGCSLLRAPSW